MCGGGGIGSIVSGIGKSISNVVSSVGSAISTVVKNPVFQAVAPIALNYFLPGLGAAASGALGLSSAWAPAIGGAISGGVFGAIGGGGLGGALKGAAIGGAASGITSYLANGTNPLSGMFSDSAGGAANNPLTAGGAGSTNLTGVGSGLGTNQSTIGTQFGINPNATGGSGGINFSANGAEGGLNAPSNLPGLGNSSSSPGILSKLAEGAKSLIPDSTLGKLALGSGALMLANGLGKKPETAAPPATPPGQDPTMAQHLQQLNFKYDPNNINKSQYGGDLNTYAQSGAGASHGSAGMQLDPVTGRLAPKTVASNQSGAEYNFFNNPYLNANQPGAGFTPVTAAYGGSIPSYAMGGLSQYAAYGSGGMPDVPTTHGYLQGPGDGVSDDIKATIGDTQPARLAGGEFVIPARIVSEIGNGSSDAGAQRLHGMMERVNQKRLATKDFAKDTKAYNLLPA